MALLSLQMRNQGWGQFLILKCTPGVPVAWRLRLQDHLNPGNWGPAWATQQNPTPLPSLPKEMKEEEEEEKEE